MFRAKVDQGRRWGMKEEEEEEVEEESHACLWERWSDLVLRGGGQGCRSSFSTPPRAR